MLLEEFLKPLGLTQRDLADGIRVPYQRVNEIINGRRDITPSTGLRLARFFGNTEGFWMNLQLRWDLFEAREAEQGELQKNPSCECVGCRGGWVSPMVTPRWS
jgi:addiction module HigA family antidote